MKPHGAVLLGALVLLGGCLGGVSLGDGGQTTTAATDATAAETSASEPCGTEANEPTAGTTTETANETVSGTFVLSDCENVSVSLEVANSPEERRQGLMFRQSLPENYGMAFVYGDADARAFWMKNTYVPLDIIFVAPDGTVLNVEHARPQPNASNDELERYRSEGAAKYVIELPRGFANRTGVESGTRFRFDGPAPTTEK